MTTYAFGGEVETPCPAMQQEAREKIIHEKQVKEAAATTNTGVRK